MAALPKFIGQPVRRREDPRLITGEGTYVDDVKLPGMLHAALMRSPYAHAKINSVDLSAARKHPGVICALSGEDLAGRLPSLPCVAPAQNVPEHPVLARGKVRYVGDPVAVVVATDPYTARDAVDLITADFDPLPAVVDPEKALQPGAPLVHENFGTNLAAKAEMTPPGFDKAMGEADKKLQFRLVNQRLTPTMMEPRGVVAHWEHGYKQLTLWSSTQIPHLLRSQLADMLKLGENKIRVIAPEVGGGFGAKLNVYAEEALLSHLAMELRRPVKWIETRRENMAATTHGRDHVTYVEVGFKSDGTITAIKAKFFCDMGAYLQLLTPAIPSFTALMIPGCYRIGALAFEQNLILTNKMATDAYRGAGRPEACYLIERTMDMVANELGIDPVEVRRKNFVPKNAFPFTSAAGLQYDSGDYEGALNKALEMVEYDKLRAEQTAARKQGRYLGIGVSTYVEICGIGPSALLPPKLKGGGWESATIRIEPDCKVTVLTGTSPHGQGEETSFAQIAADAFGVDVDDVTVIHGDTAVVQYGIGTFGSRTTALGGTAIVMAAGKLQEKMKTIASRLMEVPPQNLIFTNRTIAVASDPSKSIPLQKVVEAAYGYKQPIPGVEPGLDASAFFEPSGCTFPFGTHIAVVEVDPETGAVKFLRYVAVDDCGKIINPLLVDGQVQGGIAQGLGQALYEETVYDENGQLVTASLMDYAVPKAPMVPTIECANTVTPTNLNPLGVKGVGEAGTIGSTPCVANAVMDALKPFGIKHIDMPLKPEKIWRAIQQAKQTKKD
jgi:carbon-monoxide dehydrogenase large subunit